VIKTRAEFEALRTTLASHPAYAPHVLGLFAYHDLFNDRNEADLIARGKVTPHPTHHVGPLEPPAALSSVPGFRAKASRLVLWGDVAGQPGHNPPTFQEMVGVALTILDRAARAQPDPANRRFLLVAEQEASDNFGNQNNAVGVLQALHDTDQAIGVAREYLRLNPDTLILTAADSDAGGMQVTAPYRNAVVTDAGNINTHSFPAGFDTNPAAGAPGLPNLPDGVEGRGANTAAPGGARMFLSEPDALGQRMEFGILWTGLSDHGGGIVSRAAGVNADLLNSLFPARFDNIDVYRMLYATLFGRLLDYPSNPAAQGR
jgi:alkaline phosphatase